MSATIRDILEDEGIDIVVGADDVRITKTDNGFELTPSGGAARSPEVTCYWPWAGDPTPTTWAWRRPVCGPTPAATSWSTTSSRPTSTTSGRWGLQRQGCLHHTSYNDFEIVAANLLDGDPRRVSDRITTYAFTSTAGAGGYDRRPGPRVGTSRAGR